MSAAYSQEVYENDRRFVRNQITKIQKEQFPFIRSITAEVLACFDPLTRIFSKHTIFEEEHDLFVDLCKSASKAADNLSWRRGNQLTDEAELYQLKLYLREVPYCPREIKESISLWQKSPKNRLLLYKIKINRTIATNKDEFDLWRRCDNIQSCEEYLKKYPKGEYVGDVNYAMGCLNHAGYKKLVTALVVICLILFIILFIFFMSFFHFWNAFGLLLLIFIGALVQYIVGRYLYIRRRESGTLFRGRKPLFRK